MFLFLMIEVRETFEIRNISEVCDASLHRERERELLTVQLGEETRDDDQQGLGLLFGPLHLHLMFRRR